MEAIRGTEHGDELFGLPRIIILGVTTRCEKKLLIGRALTKGLGTGGSPDIGRKAAEMEKEKLQEILRGKNLLFLTAGMGGGTADLKAVLWERQ